MAKILAVDIRVGQLLEWEKRIWRVLKCYHVHVGGRGGAFMQVEMKDIEAGTKTNTRFRTDEKVERAYVEPREMQYLYQEGDGYVFMDQDTYDQLTLDADMLEGQALFLLPNTPVQINFHNDRPIGVELPPSVVLTVVETDPNIKNATATTSFKPAKTETGLVVQVPPFIEAGERIKVNTDDGAYIERDLIGGRRRSVRDAGAAYSRGAHGIEPRVTQAIEKPEGGVARVAHEDHVAPRAERRPCPVDDPARDAGSFHRQIVAEDDSAETQPVAKDLLQPDGRETGRPRIDARVDHVRRHHPAELADERAVGREIGRLDRLQAALVDRHFVMGIGAYIAVPREVLPDGAHPDSGHSGNQRRREVRRERRIAVVD